MLHWIAIWMLWLKIQYVERNNISSLIDGMPYSPTIPSECPTASWFVALLYANCVTSPGGFPDVDGTGVRRRTYRHINTNVKWQISFIKYNKQIFRFSQLGLARFLRPYVLCMYLHQERIQGKDKKIAFQEFEFPSKSSSQPPIKNKLDHER